MPNPDLVDRFSTSATPQTRTKKRRWRRWLWLAMAWLVIPTVTGAVVAVVWLRNATQAALPQIDGQLRLAGLSAPVTVARDAHGVPHIAAVTQDDLFFAQGYVTAQDRLWQMDLLRRNANGELSEILGFVGPAVIGHDKAQRVLEFRNTAQRIYANMKAEDRARLDDYARGVNLFIAQHQDSLPPEFKLLFYKPQPWSGADSISIGLMMVQTLDTHWDVKLARERISADLHNAKLESDLYPVGSWRDRPPTGVQVDLSQPQPAPPPTSDDEDDDRTQTRNSSGAKARLSAGSEMYGLKPVPFTPGDKAPHSAGSEMYGLKPVPFTSGAKARLSAGSEMYGLKPVPFNAGAKARLSAGSEMYGLKPVPFTSGAKAPLSARSEMYGLKPVPFSAGAEAPRGLAAVSARLKSCPVTKPTPLASVPHESLRELRSMLGLPECEGCVPGSNNWVIAGRHTASGKPLLANDMHLDLSVPNIWYMADLRAPGFHAAGVTLPGMPFVTAGHNEHVAWGFTALMGDVQDLYVEKLDGKGNYQAPDGTWKPLAVDHEVIHVRGGKDVEFDVDSTAHGPLLNPILQHETRPLALAWTIYDPAADPLPIYRMNIASNWAEFSAALGAWSWPTLNVVYSDDQGHIAYHAVGRVPLRPAGLAGVPITDNQHEWQGYIPFDAMPSAFDPPSGFLATANARVTTDKSPYPLSLEWVDPYRIERIYKSLQGRDGLTPKDMIAVQTDVYSEVDQQFAHRFAYAIDHTPGADARLRQAADLMRSWDGRLSTDSPAASLVTQTKHALWPMILQPKLGNDLSDYEWSESDFAGEEIVMHGSADWLPKKYKNWDALLTEAVRNGMETGKAPGDVKQWSYGSWHVIDLEHPLAGLLPLISRVAGTRPQPLSGDSLTVKQVGRAFGPSQRFTMDWSDVDGSTENIVLGESGNPFSPYFRDQWNDWYGGTTFALPFTQAAVTAQARHTLLLEP